MTTGKKSKAKSKRKAPKKRNIRREIAGVILIFSALFLLASLISYNPEDPSWVSSSGEKIHNFGGRVGASLAEILLQLLGPASLFFPAAFLYLGIRSILPGEKEPLWIKIIESLLFAFIFASVLSLFWNTFNWAGAPLAAGGLAGSLFSGFLARYFNHLGSLLILLVLLLVVFIFSTHISLREIFDLIARFFQWLFKEVRIRIVHYQKEKKRVKMRKKVIKKYSSPGEQPSVPAGEKPAPAAFPARAKNENKQEEEFLFPEMAEKGDYQFPPLNLLDPGREVEKIDKNELYEKKQIIEDKLMQFKVGGEVREYNPGPIVTTYEFYPNPGIKVSQVSSRIEDLSLALGAESLRIQRIPGKSSLGIEIPNNRREIIKIRDIIETESFLRSPSKLTVALGKTIHGEPYVTDLSIMPHLLIAGATGTGKSVALNSIIASILYKATPEEAKIILIDPKRLEFTQYEGMPHLLCPVVKDPKKAEPILVDAITKMDDRYHALGAAKVRNIEQYNQLIKKKRQESKGGSDTEEIPKPMPHIIIVIDELAELMMVGAQEIERAIARLAQLARAAGIHLVMATQRPSTDVITGTIKNNFACRIAFRVPSKIDSRIIIDASGAEKLLGRGDMLFMPPNYPRLIRLHSSYISLPEVTRLLKFVKEQGNPDYDETIIKALKKPAGHVEDSWEEKDELFEKAVELILLTGQASASYLQRKMKVGYARAARIIDQMEQEGVLGPSEGSKPREILVDPDQYRKDHTG
jgi:DNA segregation ATPase FtsK/SpoIIIE, S-DNA-T family